jgi:hypothetical protein
LNDDYKSSYGSDVQVKQHEPTQLPNPIHAAKASNDNPQGREDGGNNEDAANSLDPAHDADKNKARFHACI